MDVCSIEEIQNLFITYSACFSIYFPELKFSCDEKCFMVRGEIRNYKDITGVSYTASHFLIEIAHEYVMCLPITCGAKYSLIMKRLVAFS